MTAFDAPVATRVRRSAARAARTGFTAASSKATARTTQGAFHRPVPRSTDPLARTGLERETRHRSRDFAAPVRLPALLRPPLPREEGLDPAASGTLIAPGRSWPRAARRLLQSKRSASTTVGPTKPHPQVGPRGFRRAPHLGSRSRPGMRRRGLAAVVPPFGSRGFTGQGPFVSESACADGSRSGSLPPRLRATRASPQPDRLSDTSCRAVRSPRGWSRRDAARTGRAPSKISSTRPATPLSRSRWRPHAFAYDR